LHCPLTPETHHIIDAKAMELMKRGVVLINTSRGALIDTRAVIQGLKSGKIGYLGLDVYEEEADLFFEDLSDKVIQDDVFARLLTFPNVVITGHQAFFTENALQKIAETTVSNITEFERQGSCGNEVSIESITG
jgi:D-lactate dehydrogenase